MGLDTKLPDGQITVAPFQQIMSSYSSIAQLRDEALSSPMPHACSNISRPAFDG
jgi:hypothetical protein